MKKIRIAFLFLVINSTCFSQTVKELEYELSYFKSSEEWGNKKNIAFNLLEIDSLNERAINYIVEVYGRNNQKDSISFLFDRLIKENSKSPQPYLIRAKEQNAYFAGLTDAQRINYLKEACKLDSVNVKAIYSLGKLCYELFIDEFKSVKEKKTLDYYSANAIQYFSALCNQNEGLMETLKFPLIQLANYNNDLNKKQLYESYKIQSSFFPIAAFIDLPSDWQTNYAVNVIDFVSASEFKVSGVESALFHVNWYASHLNALDEPVLRDSLPAKVYRFTWLRSFHKPVVIRLENFNGTVTLYWKVGGGAGGYEPGKMIVNKSKVLTLKNWNDFVASVNSINFWNLPTTRSGIGSDGAQWILEGKELGKYHVVDRQSGGKIESVCLKLLELSNLKIKKDDIY
jgi:hypothetical protein